MNTETKIFLASIISKSVRFIRQIFKIKNNIFRRNNIYWCLDLTQGIDFAIYLQGGFEPSTILSYKKIVKKNDVVLDIGANIGAHTLPLAAMVGEKGRIIAFEPTDYAFKKLQTNLDLNKSLASRVTTVQALLVGNSKTEKPNSIPSSWSLEKKSEDSIHPVHRGTYQSLHDAFVVRLDEWVSANKLEKVDFIKIDVDGHEIDVIEGGYQVLERFSPIIIMEFSEYIFEERGRSFDELIEILKKLQYSCYTTSGNHLKMDESLKKHIPKRGSINVILKRD